MTNDNRKYSFPSNYIEIRKEYEIILKMIPKESRVIDLGCGNGVLLELLKKVKSIKETGLDISPEGIEVCKKNGLNVLLHSIDEELPFEENSFDYSICNVTLQMVMYPEVLLKEMKRISSFQIISFPNFAFFKNRFDMFFHGRMPNPLLFSYKWYNTGHIHQFSFKDFLNLVKDVGGLEVLKVDYFKHTNKLLNKLMEQFPNIFQYIPIVLLKKL